MNTTSKTNWQTVDALEDTAIDTTDIPPLTERFFAKARWRTPVEPLTVLVHVDANTYAWFQARGQNADQEMTAALRDYAEIHQAATTEKRG